MTARVTTDWTFCHGVSIEDNPVRYRVAIDGYALGTKYATRAEAQKVADQYNRADEMNRHDIFSQAD